MGFRQKATGFGRELSVRPSVRLSSRGSTELAERPKSHAEVRTAKGKREEK